MNNSCVVFCADTLTSQVTLSQVRRLALSQPLLTPLTATNRLTYVIALSQCLYQALSYIL